MQNLTAMPDSFMAGTTVTYTKSFTDYPATTWALTVTLAGSSVKSVTATASGTSFVVTFAASDTTGLAQGNFKFAEVVSKGAEVYQVGEGTIYVERNMLTVATNAAQSWAERTLAVVESALNGDLSRGMQQYQIAGRAVSRYTPEQLMGLRAQLREEVRAERQGQSIIRNHKVEFGRPS